MNKCVLIVKRLLVEREQLLVEREQLSETIINYILKTLSKLDSVFESSLKRTKALRS